MIFFYVNFDKCRKEIIRYEDKRNTASDGVQKHPKNSKKEALDLLKCHSKKQNHFNLLYVILKFFDSLSFEPVCLEPFNDARECLFRLDGQMRVCEPELNLFEECVHDPVRFEKFQRLATPVQRMPKDYFSTIVRKNYFI
ncbi:UNKNOWN [Stylonychia lemnae]|uniref:Uncharacterized protein n=1 Tax=Stylonychia lemnae TaxID=5949 RepID=A0A078BA27_STYLE|nr:UNKNOWN [Stylonychia lemnae]|eukprot:CDW91365.1 UNKNOWN [Stylonychia lemnae]